MKFITLIPLICASCIYANAQSLESDTKNIPDQDQIQKAINEFNRLKSEKKEKANEVTVVLEPPAPKATAIEEVADGPVEDSQTEATKSPVLVNGKPPSESEDDTGDHVENSVAEKETEEDIGNAPDDQLLPLPEEKEPGLEVQVKSIRKGSGKIDPKKVKLSAGFPVKPLTRIPDGWQLSPSETAPSFSRDVELQPGTVISLEITPHVISPEADGLNTFAISEPGYDPRLGYQQENTVGAILGESIAQLDADSVKMGNALSELHRLLASLPKPETPEEQPEKP